MTQFDSTQKTFILHLSAGYWGSEWHYYRVENGESKLIKKIVEYIERGEYKVKRIICHGNKSIVTDIKTDKDGSYTID